VLTWLEVVNRIGIFRCFFFRLKRFQGEAVRDPFAGIIRLEVPSWDVDVSVCPDFHEVGACVRLGRASYRGTSDRMRTERRSERGSSFRYRALVYGESVDDERFGYLRRSVDGSARYRTHPYFVRTVCFRAERGSFAVPRYFRSVVVRTVFVLVRARVEE